MHAKAEDEVIAENKDDILCYLATEVSEDHWPIVHRKTHWRLPEALPDLDFVQIQTPGLVYEPKVSGNVRTRRQAL